MGRSLGPPGDEGEGGDEWCRGISGAAALSREGGGRRGCRTIRTMEEEEERDSPHGVVFSVAKLGFDRKCEVQSASLHTLAQEL